MSKLQLSMFLVAWWNYNKKMDRGLYFNYLAPGCGLVSIHKLNSKIFCICHAYLLSSNAHILPLLCLKINPVLAILFGREHLHLTLWQQKQAAFNMWTATEIQFNEKLLVNENGNNLVSIWTKMAAMWNYRRRMLLGSKQRVFGTFSVGYGFSAGLLFTYNKCTLWGVFLPWNPTPQSRHLVANGLH